MTQAILDSGYAWEEQVVGSRLTGKVYLADAKPGQLLRDRVFDTAETRRVLLALKPGEFVYQPTLVTPSNFYERYRLDPAVVRMADCRPDLVVCVAADPSLVLRVIDIKASPGLKLSHRIQATLYTLILQSVLAGWSATRYQTDNQAGIWLAQAGGPEWFDIRAMRPPLETFLEHELQPLLQKPASEARWHLYFRCEWCPYFDHCRDEMERSNDVSRLPYLSTHGKQFLGELSPPVRTLADLEKLLADAARARVLDDCASLRGRADRLRLQAKALRTAKILSYGGSSLMMPRGEHVRLLFTAQTEPVSGEVYAYGIYAQGLKDVLGANPKPLIGVARRGDPETVAELERNLVRDLYGLLLPVHDYNASHEDPKAQKSLQAFTFDTYERELLTGVLLRRVVDPAVAAQALQVFFYFQRPELLQAEEQPKDEVFFPIAVVVQVLRSLLALPVNIVYRFADVVRLLQPADYRFEYHDNSYFAFELSNQMRSDAIFAVWYEGKGDDVERIGKEIQARLWAANSLVNGLRERLEKSGPTLFAWPPKFKLPAACDYRYPILSRLAFLTRYEMVLDYLAVRQGRMAPLVERLQSGATLRLIYTGGDRFRIDPGQQGVKIERGGLPKWLLTEDSEAGRSAMLAYNDHANRNRVWVPTHVAVALASITDVEGTVDKPNQALRLDLKCSQATPSLKPGGRYYLDRRFTDFNSSKVIEELAEVNLRGDPAVVQLLEQPGKAPRPSKVPAAVSSRALQLAREHEMTASQLAAFRGILGRTLQLVWGPPGTGKTHFLALAILCLAEAYRSARLTFRSLLTGFTHSAIDNCLRKVTELQDKGQIVHGEFPVGKLGQATLAEMALVEDVEPTAGSIWSGQRSVCLLGGTVWAIHKGYGVELADLVVIDEGSQLKVPESVIAIRRLRPGARLVIAGDDRQLPPIVQGTYPAPAAGEPVLHRSIFECLKEQDADERFTATLLENWRMNRTLCRYPAEQIYTPAYQSANEEVATRRLNLAAGSGKASLADGLLDPAHPLVVGVLEGVRATAENRIEAGLVARTAVRLRERLRDGKRHRYPASQAGDEAFWEHGLFIVSPHHAQILAIRQALARERAWQAEPFVGTVDKMQGQECEAVIVSYGVSDVEYAMGEKEFIYSLNRLNVAITRAKAKMIVFLPRPLIEPPIQVYEDDDLAEGVAFMQGLVQFAEHHGEKQQVALEEGGDLCIFRVPGP